MQIIRFVTEINFMKIIMPTKKGRKPQILFALLHFRYAILDISVEKETIISIKNVHLNYFILFFI